MSAEGQHSNQLTVLSELKSERDRLRKESIDMDNGTQAARELLGLVSANRLLETDLKQLEKQKQEKEQQEIKLLEEMKEQQEKNSKLTAEVENATKEVVDIGDLLELEELDAG